MIPIFKMKRYFCLISAIFFLILIGSWANGQCMTITPTNTEFLPLETLQAEIISFGEKNLTTTDIFLLKNDVQQETKFYLTKISQNRYFLFFDVPKFPGNYQLKIKTICNNQYQFFTQDILVKEPIENIYESTRDAIKNNLYGIPLEQLILAGKIFNYDSNFYEKMYSAYSLREDSCLKKECETKLISLSILSFPQTKDKLSKNLLAYQNSLEGSWKIIPSDMFVICNFSAYNETREISIWPFEIYPIIKDYENQTSFSLVLNCNKDINATLKYSYENQTKDFNFTRMVNPNILTYTINNDGCFGKTIKSPCDVESTTFAVLALKELGFSDNGAINWLNSQNIGLEEKSVIAYITNDLDSARQIASLQSQNGWFPISSTNYKENIMATTKTLFLLNNLNEINSFGFSNNIRKAEDYLRLKYSSQNIVVKEHVLFFGFDEDKIEPLMGIWPGLIQTKSNGKFDLILKNNAKNNATAVIILLNSSLNYTVDANTIKKITISMPFIGTQNAEIITDTLKVRYSPLMGDYQKEYNLPLIIQTDKSLYDTTNGTINSSYGNINEGQIPGEIDYEGTGTTAALISSDFSFLEIQIKQNLSNIDPKKIAVLTLKNNFGSDIEEIYITQTSSLISLIPNIEPGFISKLGAGETTILNITIDPSSSFMSKEYSGEIIAKGKLNRRDIETRIPVNISVYLERTSKRCIELRGIECGTDEVCSGNLTIASDTVSCCLGECKPKTGNNQLIGFLIIGALIVILLLVLFWMKKKQKKENAPFLEEVQKQYEKTFQRTPSHLKK